MLKKFPLDLEVGNMAILPSFFGTPSTMQSQERHLLSVLPIPVSLRLPLSSEFCKLVVEDYRCVVKTKGGKLDSEINKRAQE